MNLKVYVKLKGVKWFAAKYGCSVRSAYAYQKGDRVPRWNLALKIVNSSPVTLRGIHNAE